MGIAERETEADNAAFTNMSAVVVLRDAIHAAEKLGRAANSEWLRIATSLVLPKKGDVVLSHDGFQPDEEKGGTPDPLMGVYPLGFDMEPEVEAATLKFYLGLRQGYIGSPMLSALYGVWAAYTGDRSLLRAGSPRPKRPIQGEGDVGICASSRVAYKGSAAPTIFSRFAPLCARRTPTSTPRPKRNSGPK